MLTRVIKGLFLTLLLAKIAAAGADFLYLQPAALDYAGIYAIRDADPDITGQNTKIAAICRSRTYRDGIPQNDFAVNTSHQALYNSSINLIGEPNSTFEISDHSTAIASILVGRDANGIFPNVGNFFYEGITPDAQLDVYEFWYFLKNYIAKMVGFNADVLTISIGNTYEDWWTRGIEKLAENGLVIVAGIGNGKAVYDPVLYPGASANIIGVGVVDSVNDPNILNSLYYFAQANTEHSSFGPTNDKRCKPDLVAPGNCLVADINDNYRISGNFSSFATPVVAGTAALLIDKAKTDPALFDAVDPLGGNCVIKAILMNSADKLPYWHKGLPTTEDDHTAALDCVQGAGMLNAAAAMDTLTSQDKLTLGWTNDTLTYESPKVYNIKTDPNQTHITATLVWNRHIADVFPYEIIAEPDLRLELWADDQMLDHSDCKKGTVEHIYFAIDPNYTDYQIVVRLNDQTEAEERFALAWEVRNDTIEDDIAIYDLNYDGIVDDADFTQIITNIGKPAQSSQGYIAGDVDNDGQITFDDLQILMEHRGRKVGWK